MEAKEIKAVFDRTFNGMPERWYFNQYENGRLISSLGFKTKPLAESFARSVEKEVESSIRSGAKRRPGITERVEEAKGDGKNRSEHRSGFCPGRCCLWQSDHEQPGQSPTKWTELINSGFLIEEVIKVNEE